MTIPTSNGEEGISAVFVISDGHVSKYINWQGNRPTHSLEQIRRIDATLEKLLANQYKPNNCLVVLSKNETMAKALWEIGYQSLNMMLQPQLLGVSYKAILLDENQKKPFQNSGIKEPVAVLLLQSD